jgi:hypothetical protein
LIELLEVDIRFFSFVISLLLELTKSDSGLLERVVRLHKLVLLSTLTLRSSSFVLNKCTLILLLNTELNLKLRMLVSTANKEKST